MNKDATAPTAANAQSTYLTNAGEQTGAGTAAIGCAGASKAVK